MRHVNHGGLVHLCFSVAARCGFLCKTPDEIVVLDKPPKAVKKPVTCVRCLGTRW